MSFRITAALLASVALAGCVTIPERSADDLAVAITIDDMPVHGEFPPGQDAVTVARQIVGALRREGITNARGFINGNWTEEGAGNLQALRVWSEAGLPLGNHGWSHRHLSEISLEEFEREVARNEPLLQALSDGEEWRWFRYPYLDEGDDEAKRAASRRIIARRGYRVAAVTMDSNDWQWTAPYARCMAAGDEAAVHWLEQSYLHSLGETIQFYRHLSQQVHGRDIPYVLLLHISAFEARMLPRLLQLYRENGFRFVGLDEAQSDPAYAADNNPALPPPPKGLEFGAIGKGIPLPPRTSYAEMLEKICLPSAAAAP